jgi:hypothetical protein
MNVIDNNGNVKIFRIVMESEERKLEAPPKKVSATYNLVICAYVMASVTPC